MLQGLLGLLLLAGPACVQLKTSASSRLRAIQSYAFVSFARARYFALTRSRPRVARRRTSIAPHAPAHAQPAAPTRRGRGQNMSPAPAPDDTDAARKREILMKEPGEFSLTVTTLAFPDTKHPERRDPVEALARGRVEGPTSRRRRGRERGETHVATTPRPRARRRRGRERGETHVAATPRPRRRSLVV